MTKPYISKQKIRNFVSRVSCDKTDVIENEYEALLTQEIKSLDAFKRLEEALSEARKAAREIKQARCCRCVKRSRPRLLHMGKIESRRWCLI